MFSFHVGPASRRARQALRIKERCTSPLTILADRMGRVRLALMALVPLLGAVGVAASYSGFATFLGDGAEATGLPPRTLQVMLYNDGNSFGFVPGRIVIATGEKIRWTNNDTFDRQLVLRMAGMRQVGLGLGPLATPVLKPMESYTYGFNAPGVYEVFDWTKPDVKGIVVVKEKADEDSRKSTAFSQEFIQRMLEMMMPGGRTREVGELGEAGEVGEMGNEETGGDDHGRHGSETEAAIAVPGSVCPLGAPSRSYNVLAIDVDITLNRFGDHDPEGKMYVLAENLQAVRAEETAPLPDRVSNGLRDDVIQPLVIRANLGDCVTVNFTNKLNNGRASMVIHRAAVDPNNDGGGAGLNPDNSVGPDQTITYTWYIEPKPELEGSFYFHSHGDTRVQTQHGLFGTLIAEPAGSEYLHPETRLPLASGWEAVIQTPGDPDIPDFREFAIIYHEIGDEKYQPLDKDNDKLPLNDPETEIYRPCTRALNYRSECFMRRMELQHDESQGYGSYMFGDPATPIPRSYTGDPAKTRLMHGGAEVFHSHHLHGGAIRWRFQPFADDRSVWHRGFTKNPTDVNSLSTRMDVQGIGPGEAYNLEHECGSGGCQETAGDFLFHCHFPHHYLAGMWSFWRVFNTKNELAELPDRDGTSKDIIEPPVNSLGLIGKTLPSGTPLTQANIDAWVQSQLPAQGVPGEYDASVLDWISQPTLDGPLYLSEPEDTRSWANFSSSTPGARRELQFDPRTGLLAWPPLTPHLGRRPPFAPGSHGPAPHLITTVESTPDGNLVPVDVNATLPTNSDHPLTLGDPQRGERGLCPVGSPIKRYNVVAITLPIAYNTFGHVDQNGQIFVLAEDVDAVLAGEKEPFPLALRSNVHDCVHLTLTSRLVDWEENNFFSKVNMHIHFVQFDVQSSDGVITGMSYEQSVRPYASEGITLVQDGNSGDQQIVVTTTDRLRVGIWIGVGLGTNGIELHKIQAINGLTNTVFLTEPLVRDHEVGEAAGSEFVRYAWYGDVNFGTVYWHDHVLGTMSWGHGLFGALIVEPEGSVYRDPTTGNIVRSGPVVDIINSTAPVTVGRPAESFREMMLWFQDHAAALSPADLVAGNVFDVREKPTRSSFDLRNAPLAARDGDPSLFFSSVTHGDPSTPLLRAYEGDPVVLRLLVGGSNNTHAFRVSGHTFSTERFEESLRADALHIAEAERFDLYLRHGDEAGVGKAGDYLYYNAETDHINAGMWGIIRVHDTQQSDLLPLPGRPAPPSGPGFPYLTHTGGRPPKAPDPGNACPDGAPIRAFDVVAIETKIVFNKQAGIKDNGKLFVLSEDEQDVLKGRKRAEPLVLRANAGDCIEVELTNHLDAGRVSLNMGRLLADPQRSLGITVGYNYDQSVRPGESITYRLFAEADANYTGGQIGSAILADFAGGPESWESGLFGAIVIGPEGSRYFDPRSGDEISAGWEAVVTNHLDPVGKPAYRDFALLFQEGASEIGKNIMPYRTEVHRGITAINYRTEPLEERSGNPAQAFSSLRHGDPQTPLLEAYVGDPVRIHVLQGTGYQTHVFGLEGGHRWPFDPGISGASLFSNRGFGPHVKIDAVLDGGAGGPRGLAGDYLYLNHRLPFMEAGQWGLIRVHEATVPNLLPLPDGAP